MSQRDAESMTIGDSEYAVYMLSPMKSHRTLVRVLKMVGPAIGPVIDAMTKGGGDGMAAMLEKELASDFFTNAAKTLFEDLDEKVLDDLIKTMAGVTEVDGKPLDQIFDVWFQGKLGDMYMWLGFAMKAQWGKSLGALAPKLISQGAQAVEKRKASQSQST